MNTVAFLDVLVHDVRHALRALRRNPGFATAAFLTLAIGIGANTAVFSVVNSVLLRPLPYPYSEQLVALRQAAPGAQGLANSSLGLRLSPSMYFTYAEQNQTFQSLGVWSTGTANVTGVSGPEQIRTVSISDGVLQALRVPPALGRWLSANDQISQGPLGPGLFPGRSSTAMLTFGYWQRRFGGDIAAVGRTITVDSRPLVIVGVMPRGFRVVNSDADLILPLAFDRGRLVLAGFGWQGLARLKPGVKIAQANADLARMVPIWMHSWPNGLGINPRIYETWQIRPDIRPLKQEVIGNVAGVLEMVMAIIGLVMLIACANIANLLLVRGETRQQELAIRAALGAGRGAIVRSLLVESLMLGIIGGALGVGVAGAGLRLLLSIGPADLPRLSEISLDGRSLGFTLFLSLFSALLFGLIPVKYASPRISAAIRSMGRTASMSRERRHGRHALVVAQVAVASILLVGAGLLIRTFQALRTVQPGFADPAHLQLARINVPASLVAEPERVTRIQNAIQDKLASIPGVTSVGFASEMPMEDAASSWDPLYVEDRPTNPGESPPVRYFKYVSPGFLQTAGTRIVAGRDLMWAEIYGFKPVGMVSENLARELWGSASAALGKRIREFPQMPWREVIGVVQDVREQGVDRSAPEMVYWPWMMDHYLGPGIFSIRTGTFAIRSRRAGTEGLLSDVRQAVWSVSSALPVASVRTMQHIYSESMARTSFTLVMLGIAGAMALLLGIVGIYGVISYAVSQRTREIGIRVALGAQSREVKRMFVRYGLGLVAIGIVCGLGASIGLTRLIASFLFGISPLDPMTYATVPIIVGAAAILASYLPARRAAAVDPAETLRAE